MPLIRKTAPQGIDRIIDILQVKLFNELGWDTGTVYESNHRAYKNETKDGIIPEIYKGSKEYREVYFDDKIDASSFFLVDDTRTGNRAYTTTISIIFQLKLDEIFPNINHRADEEAHVQVQNVLEINPTSAKLSSLVVGLSNVYSGLLIDKLKETDMQPFHFFRIDMEVDYNNC